MKVFEKSIIREEKAGYLLVLVRDFITEILRDIESQDNIYLNKDKILNKIDAKYIEIKDKYEIIKLLGDTDLDYANSVMQDLHWDLECIKRCLKSYITDNGVNVLFLWLAYDIINDINHLNGAYTSDIVVPDGTTIILNAESSISSDYIDNKLNIITATTGAGTDKLYNDIAYHIKKNRGKTGIISIQPKRLILPYSVMNIDKEIFNWVRGITEIVCYEHQLEAVEEAVNYNRHRIETMETEMLEKINYNITRSTSRLKHSYIISNIDEFKDIKITVIDRI